MSKLFDLAFLSDDAFLGSVAEVKDNLCFQPGGGGGYSLVRASWGRAASHGIRDFCLKQGIFSWTINSLHVCSTN